MEIVDEFFMHHALEEAKKAFALGETPIGCVAVLGDTIIACAHNEVELSKDATAHAELLCLQRAAKVIGDWRLIGVTCYTTLEPCAMCLGAMALSRIDLLVFGADDVRHGACGTFCTLKHPTHQLKVRRGILASTSAALLKTFFQKRRQQHARSPHSNPAGKTL